ncbi:hypothetical protein JYT26_02645 [Beggiatoa alba]|nr:hypothetical protein [Beggiatoa alba]
MNSQTESSAEEPEKLTDDMRQYREGLVETQRKLNESYDKLILTLSGGALALSITFLKDIIGSNEISYPLLLLIAWGLFVLSLTSILSEILFGINAHKKAIKQVDNGTIHNEKVGGKSSYWSSVAHWAASISLVLGLLFISAFTFFNIGEKHGTEKATTKTCAEASTKAPARTKP